MPGPTRSYAATSGPRRSPGRRNQRMSLAATRPRCQHRRMKDWKPTAPLKALKMRAQLYALVRQFFAERNVLEVETPILAQAANTDPNIESFQLQYYGPRPGGTNQRWMRTSPEFHLKRLLAAGLGDCYELGRVFRNGE